MNSIRTLIGAAGVFLAACGVVRADFTQVVGTGAAVPGQGTTFKNVNLAGVDAAAGAAFIGSFTIGSTNYSGLYQIKNGVISTLADRGTIGPGGETITSIIGNGNYENGNIVFAANTSLGQTLYRYTPASGLQALVRVGDTIPGSTAPVAGFIGRGIAGDATEFSFSGPRSNATSALYASASGFPVTMADDRTRAGVAEMGNFIDFPEVSYRNGQTAFVGRARDFDDPTAPPEAAGVFTQSPGNPMQIVAARNWLVPGAIHDDWRFSEFERPRVMPDGRVGFAGGFIDEENPSNPEHYMGVFVLNPDLTWKVYITSLLNLPGLHAETLEFNQYSLETGANFFGANDVDGGSYLYYENADGVFTHLLDSYQTLDGKSISRLRMLADTAIGSELFFRADFTDGTSGIYAINVPEPTCAASLLAVAAVGLVRRRRR